MRILLAEDDLSIADGICASLRQGGHAVDHVAAGNLADAALRDHDYDLLVLDLGLPAIDGSEVLQRLRNRGAGLPVLVVTARDGLPERIRVLDLGADDYLVKPFSFEVLLARLRAVSRRGAIAQPPVMQVADLALNPAGRNVTRGGRKIALTRTEYGLLEALIKRAGRVVTRENLIESVWGFDSEVRGNTLDAFIRLLRDKVDSDGDTKLIQTVRGVGYCLRAEEA
jgi:two-component system, OmpR family, response regulator